MVFHLTKVKKSLGAHVVAELIVTATDLRSFIKVTNISSFRDSYHFKLLSNKEVKNILKQ